ncbi:MAG: AAA family ATPase [Deltaproteobacteria bacterium]|nr:AAA family ATPase [Deltaproteobacteria bacterium]
MFIGRCEELKLLESHYSSRKSELAIIYGRRRIGKSMLVKKFSEGKPLFYSFEGLEEGKVKSQISHFVRQLAHQIDDPLLVNARFDSWNELFSYLTKKLFGRKKRSKKTILFFDEIQWMASRRSKLISLIKYYWDNHWKERNVMLILCGSIASFMVGRVINSKALYGRSTLEINLVGLSPGEASQFFKPSRSPQEVMMYLLVFGTVPRHLELIDPRKSFNQNLNQLCFSKNNAMRGEVEKVFYSQFNETRIYEQIIQALKAGPCSLARLSAQLKIPSGGGLKRYLDNLERAELIQSTVPWDKSDTSKLRRYSLFDEYLHFYFKYIEPNKKTIRQASRRHLFELVRKKGFDSWMGYAFERFCRKHAYYLAEIMGFADEVESFGPVFQRKDTRFQIDLLYKRVDKVVTVCEIKFRNSEIDTPVMVEMKQKLEKLKIPVGYSVETALVSSHGPNSSLRATEFFDHHVSVHDFLKTVD